MHRDTRYIQVSQYKFSIAWFCYALLAVLFFGACGNTKHRPNNAYTGMHIASDSASKGAVVTLVVDSVSSGHATFKGKLEHFSGLVQVGIVWDTVSHANGADYAERYYLPGIQSFKSVRIKRSGFVGGTTYYARLVVCPTAASPAIYSTELSFATKPSNMEYGEFMHGGILFYVDGTGKHGLVADPVSLSFVSSGVKWQGNDTAGKISTNTKIGSGKANTDAIVAHYGTTPLFPYAALRCHTLKRGGYNDWYLPSIDELLLLKRNLYDIDQGWARGNFWSSSSPNVGEAWCLGTGIIAEVPDLLQGSSCAAVCAVRSF